MSGKYGIWKIENAIEEKSDSAIYNVIPSTLEDKSIELYENDWVMKITNYDSEIKVIESLKLYENPFACKMPSNYQNRHGFYKKNSWFVLEKYDDNLFNNFRFGKQNLNLLILNIIDFIAVARRLRGSACSADSRFSIASGGCIRATAMLAASR